MQNKAQFFRTLFLLSRYPDWGVPIASNANLLFGFEGGIGPGSGNHWTNQYNSVETNFLLMPMGTFERFYNVDLSTDEGKWAVATAMDTEGYWVESGGEVYFYTDRSWDHDFPLNGTMVDLRVSYFRGAQETNGNGTWGYSTCCGIGLYDLLSGWTLVAFSTGFDLDVVVGVGGVESPRNWGWVVAGSDKGKKFYITDAGVGVGLDVSGGVNATFYFYTGDIKNFTMASLNGPRTELNLSFSFFIDLGGGIAVSEKDDYGARVIAVKGIGGLGIPTEIGGNLNHGTSVVSPRN